MAILKCKMCGDTLSFAEGSTVAECESCGTMQTIPSVRDENLQGMFNRANMLRRKGEFDKAEQIYEKIVQADDTQAEAYWGLILCRYGIEYVEDPATFKRIPTCHRTSIDSIIADEDYKSALEYADLLQRRLYEAEAKEIDRLQREIIALSQNEDPYDVFICYKETDQDGKRTRDSMIANEIYHQLTQEGLKVFYAAITLEDKLGSAYEPCIFAALTSAKVMLVIGSKPEYFEAVWVKNEWSRFLKMVKKDRSKLLIPCYKDMDPYELPEEFAHLQAQDMGKIGFINDVVRGIRKVTAAVPAQPAAQAVPQSIPQNPKGSITQLILKDNTMYEGETFANVPHGSGKAIYVNGDVYEGNWHRGMWQGQGKLTRKSGSEWVGEFRENKAWNGQGKWYFTLNNGQKSLYTGEMQNGYRHGFGKMLYPDRVYEGNWANGKWNGEGKLTWMKGGEWVGTFQDDAPLCGKGVYYLSKDKQVQRYEGQIQNKRFHGYGEMKYPNKTYKGQWENGQWHGQGKLIWETGAEWNGEFKNHRVWTGKGTLFYEMQDGQSRFYNGEHRNGKIHGYGEMQYPDKTYKGQWENDNWHGQGELIWSKGGRWAGEFKDGIAWNGAGVFYVTNNNQTQRYEGGVQCNKFHGYGECEYADFTYKGQWQNGNWQGQGKLIWKAGGEWVGEFRNGNAWNGKGVYYIQNGGYKQRYEGEFLNSMCHGYGEYTYTDAVYKGQWFEGKRHGQGKLIWNAGGEWVGEFKDGEPWAGKGPWYIGGVKVPGWFVRGRRR